MYYRFTKTGVLALLNNGAKFPEELDFGEGHRGGFCFMKEIRLTQSKVALVDSEDYERLIVYKWRYSKGYAWSWKVGAMHRFIMQTPGGKVTDHINRDKLDNRKGNLRIVDKSLNGINSRLSKNNKLGYKNIFWNKKKGMYTIRFRYNSKNYHVAHCKTLEEAVKRRDESFVQITGLDICNLDP